MSLFRNIVFISALAGLLAGLAMTFMQYAGTVPLILRAEIYENAAPAAPAHDHGIAAKAGEAVAARPILMVLARAASSKAPR